MAGQVLLFLVVVEAGELGPGLWREDAGGILDFVALGVFELIAHGQIGWDGLDFYLRGCFGRQVSDSDGGVYGAPHDFEIIADLLSLQAGEHAQGRAFGDHR